MKITFILLLFLSLNIFSFSVKIGELKQVLKPENISVFNDELYVVERANVYIFSLPQLKFLKKIAGKGEGPGELKVTPMWYNSLSVNGSLIFIDGIDKIIFFSKLGEFIKEKKKPLNIHRMTPIKHQFVASNMTEMVGQIQYQAIKLFNDQLKQIKVLFKQKSPVQSALETTEMIPDIIDFQVYENKIFIERSREGFIIEVYNSEGDRLYQIKKNYEKVMVREIHKNEALHKFRQDPFVKQIGFERLKRMSKFVFPKFFPAIQNINVTDNHIYVRTYRRQEEKEEYVVLDLKGKILKSVYLPRVNTAPLMAHLTGVKYYTINNGTFYYILENEEKEIWEIHTQKIN